MRARSLYPACALLAIACEAGSTASQAQDTSRAAVAAQVSQSRHTALSNAVARVSPAVVTVQTEMVERVPADVFEQFFGGRSGSRATAGIGSGFIVRDNGVVVTNAHVVAGASSITVMLRDGSTHAARMLGMDETNDLAVLQIEGRGLPVATLGNSKALLVGEWAIAIGNPYGFVLGNPEPSVTAGVISGVGRNLVARGEGPSAYFDMIQTDASINPGNSGGPLVNADGEVIGVNSSIYSTTGGSVGLGFAIPINRVRRVVDDLLEHGAVRRPWVGLRLDLGRGDNPRALLTAGAVVSFVTPGSPAAGAGIRPGDTILRAGDRAIRSPFDWEAVLLDVRVGEPLEILLRRNGQEERVRVPVADLPEVNAPKVEVLREVELVSLTPAIRAERQVSSAAGAVVYRISARMTEMLGLQAGDVLTQVNRTPVGTADQAAEAIDYYAGRGPITVFFERRGQIFRSDFMLR